MRKVLENRFFKYVLMLTATPIQNRLWDLYSLVDLLTVARGHENPFGSPGLFKRNFIADEQTEARRLKPEAKDQFRSIVFNYMSRIRRGDAHLEFPDRRVLLHPLTPSDGEIELLNFIAKPIQELNPLSQVGILKAFTSSPYAVLSFLNSMARNRTAPDSLAAGARKIIQPMKSFAKLDGLANLVEHIRRERPHDWRLVVFTTSRETQTSIETLLVSVGTKVATINGQSGHRNADTLRQFRASPPQVNVIVSTEAGAEGVNLQAANILVNFDLPWNPMVVEQRVGRIQRLGSVHRFVSIYNLVLAGTFDEYIVGRLMERLQMASHAIGDIEALLETADIDDNDDDGDGFEEQIRKLVIASLAGQDMEHATTRIVQSIDRAKATLLEQEKTINTLLGGMGDVGVTGPRSPVLPPLQRSMTARDFALHGLKSLGAQLTDRPDGCLLASVEGRREIVVLEGMEPPTQTGFADYRPGTPAFDRLATRLCRQPLFILDDDGFGGSYAATQKVENWVTGFGAIPKSMTVSSTKVSFQGDALVRAKAFVAHDSYERLIRVPCDAEQHTIASAGDVEKPVGSDVEEPAQVGLRLDALHATLESDPPLSEFGRFYVERRADEVAAAAGDARKTKKLEDEYTPRLDGKVVGLQGRVSREIVVTATYGFGNEHSYSSTVSFSPSLGRILKEPATEQCQRSSRRVPIDCLSTCEVSGVRCLEELLKKSAHSGRLALPEHFTRCTVTNTNVIVDEVELSAVSGKPVLKHLLVASALSGRKAEPSECGLCEFTSTNVFRAELRVSEISRRNYRIDRQVTSSVSGKTGDKSEFVSCELTSKILLREEGERCLVTGKFVAPGVLRKCDVTGQMVVPDELVVCAESGKTAVKNLFIVSNVSGAHIIREYAVASIDDKFCRPSECGFCHWSCKYWHPDDLRDCSLTELSVHAHFAEGEPPVLMPLIRLLDGTDQSLDVGDWWPTIESATANERATVVGAVLCPAGRYVACCAVASSMMGLKKRYFGFVFSFEKKKIVGKTVVGKRSGQKWMPIQT